jgi:DNA invertase Pin-like site-specific DNA recombinase
VSFNVPSHDRDFDDSLLTFSSIIIPTTADFLEYQKQIVTELSRLGRSTGEVIALIDELIQAEIRIVILKQRLQLNKEQDDMQSLTMITLLSLFAEMERIMISRRTKEALAARKAQGIQLGKPKGTIQSSVYDKDRKRIIDLLGMGVSARKIATLHLGYGSPSSLNYYIQTRRLREGLVST